MVDSLLFGIFSKKKDASENEEDNQYLYHTDKHSSFPEMNYLNQSEAQPIPKDLEFVQINFKSLA